MERNIVILQGSMKIVSIYQDDDTATSVDFLMKNDDTDALTTINAEYVDGVAVVEIDATYTTVVGVYSYQINENTPSGVIKHGAFDCPTGDCEFGKVIICESLDGFVS